MGIYKSLNISSGTVMKNLEMLKFVLDHVKTKKMCKNAIKKLPYLSRYVPNQYKTQQMCEKAILENDETLKSVTDCYKNQEMLYPHAIEFVPECFMTQKNVSECC